VRFPLKSLLLPVLASAVFTLPASAAGTITGVVTNKTVNKPAAGDDVVLIRLAQGMQEAARTKTDAKGHFKLDVPDDGMHLVRVTHDKANYFRPAPPGTESVEVEVFNSAAKVAGVTTEANLFRVQTEPGGKGLKVVEHFFIKNDSTPQRTQFSERSFEFTLPEGAVIEGSAALSQGSMPVQSPPIPLAEKGHYAFVFPLRPGQTHFQISYRLPYSGSFQFSPTELMATDTVVVMMPKAMKFDGGNTPFNAITDEVEAQTYVARSLPAGAAVGFTVSGTGELPRQTDTNGRPSPDQGASGGPATADASAGAVPAAAGTADNKPGGGMADPINTPDPLTKYKWWIIAGIALLLAVGAGVMLRGGPAASTEAITGTPSAPLPMQTGVASATTLESVLRDELFSLETDRLSGRIPEEEYLRARAAFDIVLQRAISRRTNPPAGSNV